MARTPRHQLQIRPCGDSYQLFGEIGGKRIRKQSTDLVALSTVKAELELKLLESKQTLGAQALRLTRLSDEDLRDAEAAKEISEGHRLVEWVARGKAAKVFPDQSVTCAAALQSWLETLTTRKRSVRTIPKNRLRIADFLKFSKREHLADITPEDCEKWVYRPGMADLTRVTDAQVLRAWLKFCCAPSRRWLAVSPFEIDMKDLTATARPAKAGKILTPTNDVVFPA